MLHHELLVWTVGKVGSEAIYSALKAAGLPTVHIHTLNWGKLLEVEATQRGAGLPSPRHAEVSRALLPKIREGASFWAITAVRDPMAWLVSCFFQRLAVYRQFRDVDVVARQDEVGAWMRQRVCNQFGEPNHYFSWFNKEPREVFGLDVYAQPFDTDTKSLVASGSRLKMLVLRSDDADEAKAASIEKFIGTPVKLARRNTAAERNNARQYQEFREAFRPPAQLLDHVYSDRTVRHFYTEQERDTFRAKWDRPTAFGVFSFQAFRAPARIPRPAAVAQLTR